MGLNHSVKNYFETDGKNEVENLLVSIIVITYNSADFVLETLESAKAQTYRNLELIISDDCSTDNTVKICKEWLSKNETQFVRTKLVTTIQNTGIALNANRGLHEASGIWLKYIAGDDVLLPDCIKDYVNFVSAKKQNIECLFAQIRQFTNDPTIKIKSLLIPDPNVHSFYNSSITAREQYSMWLNYHNYWPLSTPSFFIKRELLISLGGYDGRYAFIEDLPLFLKILEHKIKIYFVPIVTVQYRIHRNSISRENVSQDILSKFQISKNKFIKEYILPRVPWTCKIRLIYELFFDRLVILAGNKGALANLIQRIGINLNPVRLNWFKRKIFHIFYMDIEKT
jgi:alpha-1,3-rhamnosyltransferase